MLQDVLPLDFVTKEYATRESQMETLKVR